MNPSSAENAALTSWSMPAQEGVRTRVRLGHSAQVQQRQCRDARAQVGARRLARVVGPRREVDDVVDQLERDADRLAEPHDRLDVFLGRARKQHPDPAGGRDQRPGLVARAPAGSARSGHHPDAGRSSRAAGRGRGARTSPPAARSPSRRATATILLARANSRSPVRIATELPQTVCALGTPRRICASSITSSW